jgi:hypothetical protein
MAVATVLIAFSLIVDDFAFLTAGSLLIFLLLYRALAFHHACRRFLPRLAFHRTTDSQITRVGMLLGVTTTIAAPETHLAVHATDLPPPGSLITSGTSDAALSRGDTTLRFTLQLGTRGRISFTGLHIHLQDAFFSESIVLRGDAHRLPYIVVYPEYTPSPASRRYSEVQRHQLFNGMRGQTVESFRMFLPGDDPRQIEWKLSAKYGRLFTRLYHSLTESPPIIVLDSPGQQPAVPAEAISQVEAAAVGMIEAAVRSYRVCSFFVITGPNIIHALPLEQNLGALIQAAGDFPRASGLCHLYREMGRGTYASLKGKAESGVALHHTGGPEAGFCSALASVCSGVLQSREPNAFEWELKRAFLPYSSEELHLFSTFQGDLSHIHSLIEAAHHRNLRSILHIPRQGVSPTVISWFSRHPDVEVKPL